ncbi:MAG: D-2-hydroxyacid dehydrogenase [Flavobacteriales bacterium]
MKILVNDGISKVGEEALNKAGFEVITDKVEQDQLIDFINENAVEVILVRSATKVRKDIIDACPSLKIIGRGGVGMDNIDVEYAQGKGIKVINTPAASSKSVAELAFAHMFSMVRFLHDSNRNMPLEGESQFKALKKQYSSGQELAGKTLGVIGFGRIATETIKIALGIGMKVVVADIEEITRDVTLTFFDGQTVSFKIKSVSLDEMLPQADLITLHVPSQGNPILGKKEFSKMKDGVGVVNTARGGVIDEEALLEAIENGKVKYAALDVFANEPSPEIRLLMNPELSLTPHIGGSTVEAQDRIGLELADQIKEIYNR